MVSVTLLTVLVFAFLWRKAPVPVIGEVSVCFWLSDPCTITNIYVDSFIIVTHNKKTQAIRRIQ